MEDSYLLALGRATYTFARLEWGIVWCLTKLQPGYVTRLGRRTAGKIADDYLNAVHALSDLNLKGQLSPSAQEFKRLVGERNGIMHGKPGSDQGGAQGLFRHGDYWSEKRLEDAADDFAACEIEVIRLFYNVLGGP